MIASDFHDWQLRPPTTPRSSCSPALWELYEWTRARWQTSSLGCYGVRPVAGGTRPSSHSYGSAIDISYGDRPRAEVEHDICVNLVAWSAEWGIQAIHDYVGCRIWRAGRTPDVHDACTAWWRAQRASPAGMGKKWATWLHIEVHPERWEDDRSAAQRGIE